MKTCIECILCILFLLIFLYLHISRGKTGTYWDRFNENLLSLPFGHASNVTAVPGCKIICLEAWQLCGKPFTTGKLSAVKGLKSWGTPLEDSPPGKQEKHLQECFGNGYLSFQKDVIFEPLMLWFFLNTDINYHFLLDCRETSIPAFEEFVSLATTYCLEMWVPGFVSVHRSERMCKGLKSHWSLC